MEITYQGLRISLPIEGLIQVEDFTLNAAFNCHASVSMLILAEEESLEASIQGLADGAAIEICEEETLFVGKITKAELVRRQGLCLLAVTAVSYTMDWELAPVSQSFLNLDATYGQVMDKVLENQPGAEIMDCVTQGAVIPDFLLQYEESDWDFLKRLASHFHTFLVPDCRAGHGRAYFGIPAYTEATVLEADKHPQLKPMAQY